MLNSDDVEYLRGLSIFAALSDAVLAKIGSHARRRSIERGAVLFDEGTPASEMVVVLEGQLEVVKRGRNGKEARLAVLGPGDVVGEMSLVDIQPRAASVRAADDTSFVSLSHADIAGVYREDPQSYTLLVLNIAREISIRLRRMDTMLANIATEIEAVTSGSAPRH